LIFIGFFDYYIKNKKKFQIKIYEKIGIDKNEEKWYTIQAV